MPYRPTGLQPERILLFGDAGSGKSHAILSLARRLTDVQFRIAEVDWSTSASRLLETPGSGFEHLTNVEIRHAYPDEWEDQIALAEWLRDESKPGDWAAYDSMTHGWSAVQEWYIEELFGQNPDDYWIQIRKDETTKANGFDGWEDWPYMKKQHNRIYKALAKNPAHVIITAEQTAVAETDKKDDRAMFSQLGFRPAGRKQLAHLPVTVGHLQVKHDGTRLITTLKDRGRPLLEGAECSDFFRDYLLKVAGWKMIEGEG